ncbi:hypothetical protein FJV80_05575 [Mesorhizobium sp. WSM4310]|nr:hypothetical protein FJV80_05575 [Mesorhizobium sp. WSM4310]
MDFEEQAGRQGQELIEIPIIAFARPRAAPCGHAGDFEEQAGRQGQELSEIRSSRSKQKTAPRGAVFILPCSV